MQNNAKYRYDDNLLQSDILNLAKEAASYDVDRHYIRMQFKFF